MDTDIGDAETPAVGRLTVGRRDRINGAVRPRVAPPEERASADELTPKERAILCGIARQTWRFFDVVVDSRTDLPMDGVDLCREAGRTWTSPTNVGVYLWSVIAATDLRLIDRQDALARLSRTLTTVENLPTWHGLLHSWYDTATGVPVAAPGKTEIRAPFHGAFISTVDNAWFAVGLILTRQAFPELAARATALLDAMKFGVFFDDRDPLLTRVAGQMYGGYVVGRGPTAFHYDLLNSETRIAAYVGIGTGTMPGSVWWRTWRTLPADVMWQGQVPRGHTATYVDPQSGRHFPVFEGHYRFGGIPFLPSWGGSVFEGLMPNLVVPETTWGPKSFGRNNRNYVLAHLAYTQHALGYPVWGLSPSSTPDGSGGYLAYGAHGLASNRRRSPYKEGAVTPHASFLALDVAPRDAFANIQRLRDCFAVDGPLGLFDAVNPVTGQVCQRYLVLDQAMIIAALDNALNDRAMQRYLAADQVGAAIHPYLSVEQFSIHHVERSPL